MKTSTTAMTVLTLTLPYLFVILGLVSVGGEISPKSDKLCFSRLELLLTTLSYNVAMESLVEKGLVKHIGVANFPVMLLHDLLSYSRIPPVVNQVEIHPYNQQSKLLDYCKSRNITVQAYSPLGTPGYKENGEPDVLTDPVLKEISNKYGMTVAQLCLQWSLQRGCHVVAKSSDKMHLEENLLVGYKNGVMASEFVLSEEEMAMIASLDRSYRFFRPEDWWKDMPVFN